jgi:hypothetical protein
MPSSTSPERERERDVHAHLLQRTRGLEREQSTARDRWYAELSADRKEETLFELEMLLKGLASFGNPRNIPGPVRTQPFVALNFRPELAIVHEALQKCTGSIRKLLGSRDRAFTFAQYLETVLSEDAERTRLIRDPLAQKTPEDSLFVLRNAFTGLLELSDGLLQRDHVTHGQHHGMLSTVVREIGRNEHFNPLVPLEFRPEFDRIREPTVLDALHSVQSDASHRVVALTFLTLFRSLRYVTLLEHYASSPHRARRSYLILAVLRSDLRALCRFLERRAPHVMADGLERELLSTDAGTAVEEHDELVTKAALLQGVRQTLQSIAGLLRMEVRHVFERKIPDPMANKQGDELAEDLQAAAAEIRATLHHAVRRLCRELQPTAGAPRLPSNPTARRAEAERIRREIWMFMQILRGFIAKARATAEGVDLWSDDTSFHFVREFLAHFRALGYPLLRRSGYARIEAFLRTLDALRETDVLDRQRLQNAIDESSQLLDHLQHQFERITGRPELRQVAFERSTAAEILRMYLDEARKRPASPAPAADKA